MGSFLGDVTRVLGAVVSAEKGDLRDLEHVFRGEPTESEKADNLWSQLTNAATVTPQGPAPLSPDMQLARAQNDMPGFLKASGQNQSRTALLDSVNASNLDEAEKADFKRRIMTGENPSKMWDDYNHAKNRLVMQGQRQEMNLQNEQRQIAGEERRAKTQDKRKKEASFEFKAKAYANENPNATAEQWAAWLRSMGGVKPDNVDQALKDLETLGIKTPDPTFKDKIKKLFGFSPSVPPANPPAGSTSSQRKLYYNPATKTVE